MKANMNALNRVEHVLKCDHGLRERDVTVEVRRHWLASFDFSARIALIDGNGEEIDHGCVLEHQFMDGSRFETQGAGKGMIELASDLKGHTADEVIGIWRKKVC